MSDIHVLQNCKVEITNPAAADSDISVPDLKTIKISKPGNVQFSTIPVLVPNTLTCHVRSKTVDLDYSGPDIIVPTTNIRNFAGVDPVLVHTTNLNKPININ